MDTLELIISIITKWIPLLLAIKSLDQSIDSKPLSIQSFRVIINYLISLIIIDSLKSIFISVIVGYLLDILRLTIFFNNINNRTYQYVIINRLPYKFKVHLQEIDDYLTSLLQPNSNISLFHYILIELKHVPTLAANFNILDWIGNWKLIRRKIKKREVSSPNIIPSGSQTNQYRRTPSKISTPCRSRSNSLRSLFYSTTSPPKSLSSRKTSSEFNKSLSFQNQENNSNIEHLLNSSNFVPVQDSGYYVSILDNEDPSISTSINPLPGSSNIPHFSFENGEENGMVINTVTHQQERRDNGSPNISRPSSVNQSNERLFSPLTKVNKIVENGETTKTYNTEEAKEIIDGVFRKKKKSSIFKDMFS